MIAESYGARPPKARIVFAEAGPTPYNFMLAVGV